MEVLNKYGIYKSVIRTLLEHAVPVLQNINMYIGQNIRKCAEKSHEYRVFLDLVLLSFTPVATNSFSCPSTQWNSIGRRNRRWKAALEPGA